MIINLSRFEGNEDTINRVKAELARRKQNKSTTKNNMTKEDLKKTNPKQTFAKDLQQDPDYNKAKKDAKKVTLKYYPWEPDSHEKDDYGVPNVAYGDPFMDQDKLSKIKQNMKTFITKEDLKNYIREALKKRLAENQPSPSRETEPGETETIPDRGTEEEKKRRRIGNPDVKPRPKAMNENEQEIIKRIVARYKSGK
jgi:hypothetical protein